MVQRGGRPPPLREQSCPAILRGAAHWVSRAAWNVDGLGGKLIRAAGGQGLVRLDRLSYRSIAPCSPAWSGMGELSLKLAAALKSLKHSLGTSAYPWHPPRGSGERKALARQFASAEALGQPPRLSNPEAITPLRIGRLKSRTLRNGSHRPPTRPAGERAEGDPPAAAWTMGCWGSANA